jgi:hypothetical protein
MAAATGKAAPLAKRPEGRNAARSAANSVHFGTKVNADFTIAAATRYASAMLFLTALAAAVSAPPPASFTRVGATVQARAFVRIISAVTVRLGEGPLHGHAPMAQNTKVRADGGIRPARLIEFE